MDKNFWKNKKVLITGHTGFKGAWLSLWLTLLKAEVAGLANEIPTEPSLYKIADIESDIEKSYMYDIRDINSVEKAINSFKPQIIFHMAAQSLVRPSYANPVETFETNVIGTVNILNVAKKYDFVKAVVIITTDKCYENKEWEWGYREIDELGGYDPYSASKACAEIVTSAYFRSFFRAKCVGVATGRAGNVIGGGDWAENRLLPDIFKAWLKNETVEIRSPEAIRPWQFVLEPLNGYLTLAEHLYDNFELYSTAWNFGPNDFDTCTVRQILEYFADNLENFKYKINSKNDLHEAAYLKLDCSKARLKLGWKPKWSLKEALKHTCNWYRVYKKCLNINNFQELKTFSINLITNFQKTGEK